MLKKNLNIILILSLLLVVPPLVYFYVTKGFNNFIKLEVIGVENHKIPDFSFINQDNEVINQDTMLGNIYVANFFFTNCPTICPVMIKNMAYVQKKLSMYPNLRFISHTVDPQRDKPDVMLSFVQKMKKKNVNIDLKNWDFVCGNDNDLYNIAKYYLVSAGAEDSLAPGGFIHSEYLVLIDKEGRIRAGRDKNNQIVGAYIGTEESQMKELVNDIKVLMAEYNRPTKKEK